MNDIQKIAHKLHLSYIKNNYLQAINESVDKQFSYENFLKIILLNETILRDENGIKARIRVAKILYLKYLEDLKFDSLH